MATPGGSLRAAVLLVASALLAPAVAVDKPEGCPEERWTQSCSGSATCASLAEIGFICGTQAGGIGIIPGCNTQCASPCCITTTTTTMTTVTGTVTATHTMTSSATETATTVTMTSITSTATVTGSTVTHTATMTHSSTETVTMTVTETLTTEMEAPEPTSSTMPRSTFATDGPFRRLAVLIKVTSVKDDTRYVTDSRVSTAYRETVKQITGLPEELVDLQMVVDAPGNLTVSYILNVPDDPAEQTLKLVEERLMKETASSFNSKLQANIDALVGHGHYTQQVVSMRSADDDGAIGISSAFSAFHLRTGLASVCLILLVLSG